MRLIRQLRPWTLLLGLLIALPSAFAQGQPAQPVVSVEFILYGWNTRLPSLRYTPRDVIPPLEEPHDVSAVQSYEGPATLNFYQASARLDRPDAPPPPPRASVTLPEGPTRFILVTARDGSDRYRIYAIPADGPDLAPSTLRLHNFTNTSIAVRYDENGLVELPAASTVTIRPQGRASVLRFAHYRDGKWRRLFSNVAELGPDGRRNIILAPSPTRPVSMYSLPLWPQKTTAQPDDNTTS